MRGGFLQVGASLKHRMRRIQLVDGVTRDLRVAVRALRAAPLVSAIVIVCFAVGIDANSAVFSLVNAVLLKPLPYPHADGLVLLGTHSLAHQCLLSQKRS